MFLFRSILLLSTILFLGCGTTTQRKATEQLLISEAVDSAIGKIDFRALSGEKVYLDTSFLRQVKGIGFVNSEYIVSSLRQQLTAARCLLQDDRSKADVIVEARVGALGTDGHEVTYGIPQTGALASAAAAITSTPIAAPLPELSIGRSDAHSGVAKIVAFAYDQKTKQPLWQSGIAKAESTSKNTWLLGAGPFQRGSIYEGVQFAGTAIKPDRRRMPVVDVGPKVHYGQEHLFPLVQPEEQSENLVTVPLTDAPRTAETPSQKTRK